jgi:hypothetical protein
MLYHLEIPMRSTVVKLERVLEATVVVVSSFDFEQLRERVKVMHYSN